LGFLFAGVVRSDGTSAAIVTRPPEPLISDVHDREPVVLREGEWAAWLAGEKCFRSIDGFERIAVSRRVSNWRNDDASLIEPVEPEASAQPSFDR
jgi:putative SOS response-associated peptidase YedK